jgi:deoxycytidine triphosphate deaminase
MIHLASEKTRSNLSQFDSNQVQPNAIDLKVDKIFQINEHVNFAINETTKTHRGSLEMIPDESGDWHLGVGTYEIIMEGEITIGPDEAGWVITRSTLNRNGLFITSGLYDSGYQGVMAGALHVNVGPAVIRKGTRVGQFLLFKAEALNQYDGDYGTGKADEKMYKTETYLHHQEQVMATSPEEQKIYNVRRTD